MVNYHHCQSYLTNKLIHNIRITITITIWHPPINIDTCQFASMNGTPPIIVVVSVVSRSEIGAYKPM